MLPPPNLNPSVLSRAELPAETVALARFLIGKLLVRRLPEGNASGRIVETEAYVVGDAAGHAYRGMTPRNRSLFLEHGHAYVCLVRGRSYLMNVSSERAGVGAGVLIRALEPCDGMTIMQRNRGTTRLLDLVRGPGRLTQALQIDRRLDGVDLCREGALWLGRDDRPPCAIEESTRIGIRRDAWRLLRFYCANNRFVSGQRRSNDG
jgi:DNA-3-methyladenine glycosylase